MPLSYDGTKKFKDIFEAEECALIYDNLAREKYNIDKANEAAGEAWEENAMAVIRDFFSSHSLENTYADMYFRLNYTPENVVSDFSFTGTVRFNHINAEYAEGAFRISSIESTHDTRHVIYPTTEELRKDMELLDKLNARLEEVPRGNYRENPFYGKLKENNPISDDRTFTNGNFPGFRKMISNEARSYNAGTYRYILLEKNRFQDRLLQKDISSAALVTENGRDYYLLGEVQTVNRNPDVPACEKVCYAYIDYNARSITSVGSGSVVENLENVFKRFTIRQGDLKLECPSWVKDRYPELFEDCHPAFTEDNFRTAYAYNFRFNEEGNITGYDIHASDAFHITDALLTCLDRTVKQFNEDSVDKSTLCEKLGINDHSAETLFNYLKGVIEDKKWAGIPSPEQPVESRAEKKKHAARRHDYDIGR